MLKLKAMKTIIQINALRIFVLIFMSSLILVSCKKKEEPNMVPDPILDKNYTGTLYVSFTNTLPPWNVSTTMDVEVDKELGVITFDQGTLSYSGDTVIQGSSKLERTGQWKIIPTGIFMKESDVVTIEVDGGVFVQNDVQRIYAKDDNGNWVLVNETTFNENPNADLVFNFKDAQIDGSYCGVSVATGSIMWKLTLIPALTP